MRGRLRLVLAAIAVLGLSFLAPPASPKKPATQPCLTGRFMVLGRPIIDNAATGGHADAIILGQSLVSLGSGCPPVAVKHKRAKGGSTKLRATWPACSGVRGKLRLRATINSACSYMWGTTKTKGAKAEKFEAAISACGDGMLDPASGEVCDGGEGCSPGERCARDCDRCERAPLGPLGGDTTTSTVPQAVCGDGLITEPESCDDGNTNVDDNCPEDCRIEPCVPTEGVVQTVTLTASRPDLTSIRFLLDYPDGRVALGGGAGPDVPLGTMVDTPDGADLTPFDLEHAIRVLIAAPFTFETVTIARVNFLGCTDETPPRSTDYRCIVIDAADEQFMNVTGVTCSVSIAGESTTTSVTTTTSSTATTSTTTSTSSTTTTTAISSTSTTSTLSTTTSTSSSTVTSTTSSTTTTTPSSVACSASGLDVTVALQYPEPLLGGISAILLNVSYPPPLAIPGSGAVATVRQRVTNLAGPGSSMSPNDRDTNTDTVDDRLDVQARASTTGSLNPAPVFRIRYDCPAGTSVSPSSFGCTHSQATGLDAQPFPPELAAQISCVITVIAP